jgi:hypothetical protein
MPAFEALILTIVLSVGSVLIHYEALRLLSLGSLFKAASGRIQVIAIIIGILLAHIAEAAVFAAGYAFAVQSLGIGRFSSPELLTPLRYFYFSIETYTTQGVGDVYATGAIRLLASVEPLIGLILIGWSTSFTFLVMRKYWRRAA